VFTTVLLDAKITISMDGKDRCMDNIFYRASVVVVEIRGSLSARL